MESKVVFLSAEILTASKARFGLLPVTPATLSKTNYGGKILFPLSPFFLLI
ncbi:MAG TPA: hypothetical protein PK536_09295 [Ignavibacteria bacterium]|nr:hypothetical protein [Ignavibacteria bacterium]HRJ99711.1 hypothetical protein [Ignavibacteria bacterium]